MTTRTTPPGPSRRTLIFTALAGWNAVPAALADTRAAPAPADVPPAADPATALQAAVAARERAFAATMARRDLVAFADFVSEEAVFLDGGRLLTGRPAIVRHWSRYFDGPAAPFAWEPDLVAVLASGMLATTTGPVRLPDGSNPSRFHSTWRREADGAWRVVFDSGYRVCRCADPA